MDDKNRNYSKSNNVSGNVDLELIDQRLKRTAQELEISKKKLEAQDGTIIKIPDYPEIKSFNNSEKISDNTKEKRPINADKKENTVETKNVTDKNKISGNENDEDTSKNNNIPIKYSNSSESLYSINKRINDINELSEKYNWRIKPNTLKYNENDDQDIRDTESKMAMKSNKYKSYSMDSYGSKLNDKNDLDLPKKYENNYIFGANVQNGRSTYNNSEVTNSPYLRKETSYHDSYLSNNKKILYGDDYDNLNKKDYGSKNFMLDTEELGKELDSLLNHIRTTRNNTTYGLFDKKYKYTKSYSYGNPNEKEDFTSSSSFSRRMNSISGTQDYTPGGYSSLNTTDNNNNNNPYYSQSYLSSSDKNSKLDKFGK